MHDVKGGGVVRFYLLRLLVVVVGGWSGGVMVWRKAGSYMA